MNKFHFNGFWATICCQYVLYVLVYSLPVSAILPAQYNITLPWESQSIHASLMEVENAVLGVNP